MQRILLILAVMAVAACGPGPRPSESSPLYGTVPSRSVAVMHFSHCSQGLALMMDSTSLFRTLDYGRMADNEAILSYGYSAGLVPLLCVDAGRAADDTSAQAAGLLRRAELSGLKTFYTARMLPKRAAVLLSLSQAAIDEAVQHIGAGTSILDAPGFAEAMQLALGGAGEIFLKNGAARRWLPASVLKSYIPRKDLVSFIADAAQWSVLNLRGYGRREIGVSFHDGGGARFLSHLFAGLEASDSKAADAVPASSEFVLDLPLADWRGYYDAYVECLDVRSSLSRHKAHLAALRKQYAKNPLDWAKERSPREIALVRWEGREVLMLRPEKRPKSVQDAQNPCPGFVPALFGSAFTIADDSCMGAYGDWLVYGSAEDVDALREAEKERFLQGIPRKLKYLFWTNELQIYADGKNTFLDVN